MSKKQNHSDDLSDEQKVEQELAKQEECRSSVTSWKEPNADGDTITTAYFDDLDSLKTLDMTAKRLAKSASMPTKEIPDCLGNVAILPTQIGKCLIELCHGFDPELPARHAHHTFNPWIQVMVDALCQRRMGTAFGKVYPTVGILPEDRDTLHEITAFVRQECQSKVFKGKLALAKKLALQNFRSGRNAMISLFERYSKLLILRIDLYYHGEGRDEAGTVEAEKAIERFLRLLRSGGIVDDVLKCLLSREAGARRGIHFHVLVVIDGHKHKDADGFTRMIGERWEKDYAGAGRGTYFNCYARRHVHPFNGLGLVHLADWRKLIGVRETLRYMTKATWLVKVKQDGKRNWRAGQIKRDDVKLGAPRQHDMTSVLRILGEQGWSRHRRSK